MARKNICEALWTLKEPQKCYVFLICVSVYSDKQATPSQHQVSAHLAQ